MFRSKEERAWEGLSAWRCRIEQNQRAGAENKTERAGTKTIPTMFVGILAVLTAPVRSKQEFKAVGYDCSAPTNIRVYNTETHCQTSPEVVGESQKVKIPQHVNSEQISGFKCKVTAHQKLYYCGMFSYSKPILSAEREQSIVISVATCNEMASRKVSGVVVLRLVENKDVKLLN